MPAPTNVQVTCCVCSTRQGRPPTDLDFFHDRCVRCGNNPFDADVPLPGIAMASSARLSRASTFLTQHQALRAVRVFRVHGAAAAALYLQSRIDRGMLAFIFADEGEVRAQLASPQDLWVSFCAAAGYSSDAIERWLRSHEMHH